MSSDLRVRKEFPELHQQQQQLLTLFLRARVGRVAFRIQTTLIANADGATVPGAAVRAHFLQLAMLGDDARAADVEMIPDGAELALAVAAQQVLYGEVPVLAGGGAVNDDIFHLLHVRSVLDAFQQFSFARHFLIGGEQGEGFFYHRLKGKVVQLVMPSAVRAAIAAWMMA